MEPSLEYRKVAISPIRLLRQSLDLMGDQYWLFVGITFVGMLISSLVPMGILMGPMMCGMYLCYLLRMKGQSISFETLFRGFDYFVESLIATLIIVAASFIVVLPLMAIIIASAVGAAASGNDEAGMVLVAPLVVFGYLGILVLSALISVLFIFVYPLIVDRQLTAIPALKTSAMAAMSNLVGILLLLLVNAVISILASCACILPVYLFMPIALGTTALVYRDVFSK
jgi:hypothetical protein